MGGGGPLSFAGIAIGRDSPQSGAVLFDFQEPKRTVANLLEHKLDESHMGDIKAPDAGAAAGGGGAHTDTFTTASEHSLQQDAPAAPTAPA